MTDDDWDAALQSFMVMYPEHIRLPFVVAAFATGYRMRKDEEERGA